jgi:Fe-Mn family superoxide dismutase
VHHDKHLGAYVDNLNPCSRLQRLPQLSDPKAAVQHLLSSAKHPNRRIKQRAAFSTHELYFSSLKNPVSSPSGNLAAAIDRSFDSFDSFKSQFRQTALSVFGSGYAFLAVDRPVHQNRGFAFSWPRTRDSGPMGKHADSVGRLWEHPITLTTRTAVPIT